MLVEERIARIGLFNPGSHLGIPYSHVSAKYFFLYKEGNGVGGGGGGGVINYKDEQKLGNFSKNTL
jgi:hypothetical protein